MGIVAIKKVELDTEIREESALISQVERKYWIIDSGCSHNMTSDIRKFVKFKSHDGGIVRVGNYVAYHITRIRSITLDNKTNTDDVYFVDGLKHNLLSVGKLVDKVTNYTLVMTHVSLRIRKKNCLVLAQEPEVMYFSSRPLK